MGVGTASVVCPISEILYEDEIFKVPTMEQKDPLYKRFYHTLNDIQYGRGGSAHPWTYIIDPKNFWSKYATCWYNVKRKSNVRKLYDHFARMDLLIPYTN